MVNVHPSRPLHPELLEGNDLVWLPWERCLTLDLTLGEFYVPLPINPPMYQTPETAA